MTTTGERLEVLADAVRELGTTRELERLRLELEHIGRTLVDLVDSAAGPSLRDHFAMAALRLTPPGHRAERAEAAYKLADAMMAARLEVGR